MRIHTAYALQRGSYRARAFVQDRGVKSCFTMGIGDTVAEAEGDALRYIREQYERDDLEAPTEVIHHGRMRGALVDASLFGDAPPMPRASGFDGV